MGEEGATPPPAYAAVMGTSDVGMEMNENKAEEGKSKKDASEKKKEEEDGPPALPPVGLFELVHTIQNVFNFSSNLIFPSLSSLMD